MDKAIFCIQNVLSICSVVSVCSVDEGIFDQKTKVKVMINVIMQYIKIGIAILLFCDEVDEVVDGCAQGLDDSAQAGKEGVDVGEF